MNNQPTVYDLETLEDIRVDSSGYDRYQSVFGWMDISFDGVLDEFRINVEEVTTDMSAPDVFMTFDLEGCEEDLKRKILNFFGSAVKYDEQREHWLIVDENLIIDLYQQYG